MQKLCQSRASLEFQALKRSMPPAARAPFRQFPPPHRQILPGILVIAAVAPPC
jgi:hypothetical protein